MELREIVKDVVGVVIFADGDALPGVKSSDFVKQTDFVCIQSKLSQMTKREGKQIHAKIIPDTDLEACL